MRSSDLRISCATDFEPRHYRFERASGIPYGYFGPTRQVRATRALRRATLAVAVLALLALGLWVTSATVPDEMIRADAAPVRVQR